MRINKWIATGIVSMGMLCAGMMYHGDMSATVYAAELPQETAIETQVQVAPEDTQTQVAEDTEVQADATQVATEETEVQADATQVAAEETEVQVDATQVATEEEVQIDANQVNAEEEALVVEAPAVEVTAAPSEVVVSEAETEDKKEESDAKVQAEKKKKQTKKTVKKSKAVVQKEKGLRVIQYALKFVGNPYRYGGTSLTRGTDCSGFVRGVYRKFGISLPRTSYEQSRRGKKIFRIAKAQAGDLIRYSGHIALYMGNGKIVHASNRRDGIKISQVGYRRVLGIRRVL